MAKSTAAQSLIGSAALACQLDTGTVLSESCIFYYFSGRWIFQCRNEGLHVQQKNPWNGHTAGGLRRTRAGADGALGGRAEEL